MDALRRGVDVVVGTPGRVMDLLDRKRLIGDKVRADCVWVKGSEGCAKRNKQHEQQLTQQQQRMQQEQKQLAQTGLPDWQTAQAVCLQR
jgi:hypothetical protein